MKLSKKGVLLFAATMALCALTMPSVASAASWTGGGVDHTLDSPNLGFTGTTSFGPLVARCTSSSLTATAATPPNLEITAASFARNCTVDIASGNICTMTMTATKIPWTVTALTTSSVLLQGFHASMVFEQSPAGTCPGFFNGIIWTNTGGMVGAWNAAERAMIFSNAEGIQWHSAVGTLVVTTTGTFRDTQQTLGIDS